MKLKLDITPDLVAAMAAEVKAGETAVTAATREAGAPLKTAWRAQITGAGLGARLARTIRSEQFPKARPSLIAAGLVWSNAPVIVGAHDTGRGLTTVPVFPLVPQVKLPKRLDRGRDAARADEAVPEPIMANRPQPNASSRST